MKHPNFIEGAVFAFVAALGASVVHTTLTPILGHEWVFRLIIPGLGLGYVLYLLLRAQERIGRITAVFAWLLMAGLSWLFLPGLVSYLVAHLGSVWLIRSLYHQSGGLTTLADLMLNAVALMSSVWALVHSGSLFLSVWSFFLVQALFVFIRSYRGIARKPDTSTQKKSDHFQQAYRTAETALRKLSSVN